MESTLGYFVCYGTVRLAGDLSWRFPFGLQAIAALIYTIGAFFLPHSPRWLKHVGREAEAAKSWARLGFTAAEAEKEEETTQRDESRVEGEREHWWVTVKQVMDKSVRRRTLLGILLMAAQQVCFQSFSLFYLIYYFRLVE